MTNANNVPEKAKNYTPEMEEALRNAAPVSFEDAIQFARDFGKTPRSVVAKVKQMELEYIPKPKPAKKVSKGDTKSELVAKIEKALDSPDYLGGLEKATVSALVNLKGCIEDALKASKA